MSKALAVISDGIAPLLARFDGFLLDQFGVLHDGRAALPGALDALHALRRAGKTVLILSNSGRRAAANATRLAALGISADLHAGVLTSGEVAWRGLAEQTDPTFADLGAHCLFVSRGGERSALDGLPVRAVATVEAASFVYLSGVPDDAAGRAEVEGQLQRAVGRGLVMLCSNPDLTNVDGSELREGPGAFAARYAAQGGEVRFIGKPHPVIYRAALAQLGLAPSRVIGLGDSLGHDVLGAHRSGLASALIGTGVHGALFAQAHDQPAMRQVLARLQIEEGIEVTPTYLLRRFAP